MRDLDEHIFEGMNEEMADFQLTVEDHVWTAIESDLGLNERKKRLAWWWWILGGIVLVGMTWWLFAAITFDEVPKSPEAALNSKEVKRIDISEQTTYVQESIMESNEQQIESKMFALSKNYTLHTEQSRKKKSIPEFVGFRAMDQGDEPISAGTNTSALWAKHFSDPSSIIEPLKIDSAKSKTLPDSSNTEVIYANKDEVINVEPIKRKSRWSLMAYGAVGVSYRTLSGNQAQLLVDHRNTHESRGLSINAGLAANIDISSKLFVRAGLAYAEYQEKYSFHHDVISHETVNDYNYLQLTASVGTVLFGKERSKFALLGGPKIGRLLNAQSSWVDPSSLNAVAHSSGQNNQPFQHWTAALNVTLEYQLTFTPRITGHAQLSLDGNLNSTYKKSTLLTQRPYALLFGLGVRYGF